MSTTQTIPSDDELDRLMAELDEENRRMMDTSAPKPATVAKTAPAPTPEAVVRPAEPARVVEPPKSTPQPAPAQKPVVASEQKVEPTFSEQEIAADPMKGKVIQDAAPTAQETARAIAAAAMKARAATAATPAPAPVTPVVAEKQLPVETQPAPKPEPAASEAKFKPESRLKHYVDPEAFKAEIAVTETNLDNCMIEQAGLRASYGAKAAYAEAQHKRLKAQFELLEAQLFDKHRKAIIAGGDKATEAVVNAAVVMDPKWIAGKNMVIEAETIAEVNRALVFSLVDRKDMLVQLGSDRRAELQGQVRIMASAEAGASLADRALKAGVAALGRQAA